MLSDLSYLYYIECAFNWDLYSSDFVSGVFVCSSLDEVDVLLGWHWTHFCERNLEYNSDPDCWEDPWIVSQLHPNVRVSDSEGHTYRCDITDLNLLEEKIQDHTDSPWVNHIIDSIKWMEHSELTQTSSGSYVVYDPFDLESTCSPPISYNPATARPQPAVVAGTRW